MVTSAAGLRLLAVAGSSAGDQRGQVTVVTRDTGTSDEGPIVISISAAWRPQTRTQSFLRVVWLSVVVFVSVGTGLGLGGSAGVATAVVAIWIGCFISRALIR